MITSKHRKSLAEKGYAVISNVLTPEECDLRQEEYRKWLSEFPEGAWPYTKHSLIQKYSVAHLETTWMVRLKAYPVFADLWKTKKLLTSMDAIAIGRPPEDNEEPFWAEGQSWLHIDQSAERVGLHAYQGAVYLEECSVDDWTFQVIEGSHLFFDEFMDRIQKLRCVKPSESDLEWLYERGCTRKRIPCPKGGLVLWDSRLVHANARPIRGRENPGRWRYVVFVCMTPASWAKADDLELKVKAYTELDNTAHWPSRGVVVFNPNLQNIDSRHPKPLSELPEIARTDEVKRLVGVLPYPDDDQKQAIPEPEFNIEKWKDFLEEHQKSSFGDDKKYKKY